MNPLIWFLAQSLLTQLIIVYLLLINVITFFYYGWDKMQALLSKRRISENMLWFLTLIGGSIGALGGMYFFRHKTKKISFQAGIAVILIIQIFIAVWLFQ